MSWKRMMPRPRDARSAIVRDRRAAGGVRTFDRLLAVRALGVTRVGATASQAILDECKARLGS